MKTYTGKVAYKGSIVDNYEKDRIDQTIWQKEQDWISRYLKELPSDSVLLDIPVGSGRFISMYNEYDFAVYGLDISTDMIEHARTKISNYCFQARYQFEVGDAEKIKLPGQSVDYIICFRLFHLIPFDIIKIMLKEFYRVVKKEVIIEIFDSSLIKNHNIAIARINYFKDILRQLYRKINPLKEEEKIVSPLTPWAGIENYTLNEFHFIEELLNVGFEIKSVDRIDDKSNPVTIYILVK